MAASPIGIFDSGSGGLTVVRVVTDQLPHESLGHRADAAGQPDGPEPIPEVGEYALQRPDHLVSAAVGQRFLGTERTGVVQYADGAVFR